MSRYVQLNLGIKYSAYMLLSKKNVYIKAANGVWFEISMETKKTKVIGMKGINLK